MEKNAPVLERLLLGLRTRSSVLVCLFMAVPPFFLGLGFVSAPRRFCTSLKLERAGKSATTTRLYKLRKYFVGLVKQKSLLQPHIHHSSFLHWSSHQYNSTRHILAQIAHLGRHRLDSLHFIALQPPPNWFFPEKTPLDIVNLLVLSAPNPPNPCTGTFVACHLL